MILWFEYLWSYPGLIIKIFKGIEAKVGIIIATSHSPHPLFLSLNNISSFREEESL